MTLCRCAHRWQAYNRLKQLKGPVNHDILPDVRLEQRLRVRYVEGWEPTPWLLERL